MSDLVGNHEDPFSCVAAQIINLRLGMEAQREVCPIRNEVNLILILMSGEFVFFFTKIWI